MRASTSNRADDLAAEMALDTAYAAEHARPIDCFFKDSSHLQLHLQRLFFGQLAIWPQPEPLGAPQVTRQFSTATIQRPRNEAASRTSGRVEALAHLNAHCSVQHATLSCALPSLRAQVHAQRVRACGADSQRCVSENQCAVPTDSELVHSRGTG